jgi:phosphinothricin acetyltransferase
VEHAVEIEALTARDWTAVERIFDEGIRTGDATFETSTPEWEKWDAGHLATCRLVARAGDEILGWAALSPVSNRRCYAGVAEVSLYIAGHARSRGVGTRLLSALIEASERAGIWSLQSLTFPENTASLALQQRHGFRVIGRRERIACRDGRWRDVVLLERRSNVAGT